jgi:hypothetical protein
MSVELFVHELPASNDEARRHLYRGTVYQLPATGASLALVEEAQRLLRRELGDDPRSAHARLAPAEFFDRMGAIRRLLFLERRFHHAVARVVEACGFEPARTAFDPVRLRVVLHGGHEDPRTGPVYYPHRDTWYSHSQSVIAWWIPLDDLSAEETFVFYPDAFRHPVPNDSESFEYTRWVERGWGLKIGWQDRDAGLRARYPGVTGPVETGPPIGFACRRGDNLFFSGAHFHRTLPQATGRTRFSLDFRVVDLVDHERGIGAPNVDNRSRGSALVDYVRSIEVVP